MKRYIVILLLIILSISCTKIQLKTEKEYPLTFIAYSQYATKGYVSGPVLYETAVANLHKETPSVQPRDIYLSAYIYPQVQTQSQTHFCGEKFVYDDEKSCWCHNPVYYWPFGAKMDFLAISSSSPFVGENIVWRSTNGANQVKLVVPSTRTQDDILYASSYHQTNEGSNVPLIFKHAQAWLEMKMKVIGDAEDIAGFRVTSVTLEDVYTAGELTIVNNDGQAEASWDFRKAERKDTPFDDPYGTINRAFGTDILYMDMLVPEQEKKDIVVRYTFSEGGKVQRIRCKLPHSYWLQGCKYIYQIDFEPHETLVTANLVDWDAESPEAEDIK